MKNTFLTFITCSIFSLGIAQTEKQVGDFKKINRGWRVVDSALDYEITKVDLAFLNPEKRMRETTKIVLLSKE